LCGSFPSSRRARPSFHPVWRRTFRFHRRCRELYAGAYHVTNPAPLLQNIADLLNDVQVLDYDHACAEQFGKVRGSLLQQGISVPTADLMIAAVALVHNLTLVTNNTADFQNIPGLRLDDWLTP